VSKNCERSSPVALPCAAQNALPAKSERPRLRPRSRRGILSGNVEINKYARAVKITENPNRNP